MNNMRRGFTMIELIFVIVIIGILAAVAIPKLSATRDDAKTAKSLANLVSCIKDVGAEYTATGDSNLSELPSCISVEKEGCFGADVDTNGTLTVTADTTKTDPWCAQAQTLSYARDLNGTRSFGGSKIIL